MQLALSDCVIFKYLIYFYISRANPAIAVTRNCSNEIFVFAWQGLQRKHVVLVGKDEAKSQHKNGTKRKFALI